MTMFLVILNFILLTILKLLRIKFYETGEDYELDFFITAAGSFEMIKNYSEVNPKKLHLRSHPGSKRKISKGKYLQFPLLTTNQPIIAHTWTRLSKSHKNSPSSVHPFSPETALGTFLFPNHCLDSNSINFRLK